MQKFFDKAELAEPATVDYADLEAAITKVLERILPNLLTKAIEDYFNKMRKEGEMRMAAQLEMDDVPGYG